VGGVGQVLGLVGVRGLNWPGGVWGEKGGGGVAGGGYRLGDTNKWARIKTNDAQTGQDTKIKEGNDPREKAG